MDEVKIKKGSVLVYRIFDIAEEIQLSQVPPLIRDHRGTEQFKLPKYIDRALIMKSRPVTFGWGEVELPLDCGRHKAQVLAKLRDYGVLSLIYQIQIEPGTTWTQLLALASDLEEGSDIDPVALEHAKEITHSIQAAIKQPSSWDAFEDYIIYFLQEFEGDISAQNLLEHADVPALLLAEDDAPLAKDTRKSILENTYQYSTQDLALVEWNSALVVEPNAGRELPDILEFAVTHLLEMRYYDDLLDKRMNVLYEDIAKSKTRLTIQGRFAQIYQDASSRYIEFSEFIERVENSLKVVGDFYLATVYRAATRKFRLSDWQQNITRKMNLLAQVSSLLQGEVNMRRSHWMEITIILLIAFEVVSALLRLY